MISQAVAKFPDLRVLAIEDYMTNLELFEAMLIDLACQFEIVDSFLEAIEKHRNCPFDVIVIDTEVPDMDRKESIRALRSLPGASKHTPVVVIVGAAPAGNRSKWQGIAINHEIEKPIKIRKLQQVFLKIAPRKALI